MLSLNQELKIGTNHYHFNMEGYELVDKAMNIGYKMIMGEDLKLVPNDSNEEEDMIFIPDPEQSEMELAEDLLEYFIETEEYEKCADIRDVIKLNNILKKLINVRSLS